METEDMSENINDRFQQLTNEELIDLALQHSGQEHESIRHLALQEHFLRVKDDPRTVMAPMGDVEALKVKLAQQLETQSGG
jgi:hypothetical protein